MKVSYLDKHKFNQEPIIHNANTFNSYNPQIFNYINNYFFIGYINNIYSSPIESLMDGSHFLDDGAIMCFGLKVH